MSSGKFVWMIGNDDLLLPNSLSEIKKKLFKKNPEVEYFFINSFHLPQNI